MDTIRKLRGELSAAEAGVLAGAALMLGLFMFMPEPAAPRLPELASLEPGAKKERFFEFLRPVVVDANARVRRDRARLAAIAGRIERGAPLSWFDESTLTSLAEKYKVELGGDRPLADTLDELEERVGIVPPSLALVQAAKESGWGTSRFALEGNNLYGQRCYEAGCGIRPRGRPDANFGVARFDSVAASVESYIRNLNTHPQYAPFRELRDELRDAGEPLTGIRLADGLIDYSERGEPYVAEIKSLIRQNGLAEAR